MLSHSLLIVVPLLLFTWLGLVAQCEHTAGQEAADRLEQAAKKLMRGQSRDELLRLELAEGFGFQSLRYLPGSDSGGIVASRPLGG